MEELVKRLRSLVVLDEVGSNNTLGIDAADALEAQQARIAELREALEIANQHLSLLYPNGIACGDFVCCSVDNALRNAGRA